MRKQPKYLILELTNHCNADCVFCYRGGDKGFMDLEFFKQVVMDFPAAIRVLPFLYGESMIHPLFLEALEFVKSQGKALTVYTNGSLMDKEKSGAMIKMGVDEVRFSVEADNKELYEKLRVGLNWETFLENIRYLQENKKSTLTTARIGITPENKSRIGEIEEFWKKRVDRIFSIPEQNRGGRENDTQYKYKKCQIPFEELTVRWNGDVILCCGDWEGKMKVDKYSKDIWLSKEFNDMRKRVNTENQWKVCRSCRSSIT